MPFTGASGLSRGLAFNTHGSPKVEAAILARGTFRLFLPTYSPDMDPIEKAWDKSKTFLRGVGARTGETLRAALAGGRQTITPADAPSWFRPAAAS